MHYQNFSKGRLFLGLIVAAFAVGSYFMSAEINPITGEKQHLAMSAAQEIAMGLQAAPQMAQQYGGLSADAVKQDRVDRIGRRLVEGSVARDADWRYDFHVLADRRIVNAFALPGGQVFITQALLDQLKTDDHIASVLAHEIGHVLARHGAQQMAKVQLTQGLSSAAVMASGDYNTGRMAAMIGQVVNMKYGREDELESDTLGVRLMHEAGYDPQAMIDVMHVLEAQAKGSRPPEFFSTHPNPENRIQRIHQAIDRL
jgi:predicted Zn-dependent protease